MMAGSAAEREIRDAVVYRLREEYPNARIIHELNCGHGKNRIDVAAVTPNRIISVEIKSEKDKLSRLADQVQMFRQCSHRVIVVAHEKFFEDFQYHNGRQGFRAKDDLRAASNWADDLWIYPKPTDEPNRGSYLWRNDNRSASINSLPDTREILRLLWTDELRKVAEWGAVAMSTKTPGYKASYHLWELLTGAQLVKAACAILRAREFAEADPPLQIEQSPLRAGLLASVQ